MPMAQTPSPARRLTSLPARIVLFVCTATLVTAVAVGAPALRAGHEAVRNDLDQTSRTHLAWGHAPAASAASPAWERARLGADGRMANAGDAPWPLPHGWPDAGHASGAVTPLVHFTDPGGTAWVLRAAPAPDGDGWVVVRRPFEAAYAPLLGLLPRLFVLGCGSVLLFCLLAYALTARAVRPIELLASEARRISRGDLSFDLSLPVRTDEVGLLTRTFHDMVRRLHRNQREIEEANLRLTDQNQQLQRANEILAQLSITDGLTRLHNHRFFQDQLGREIKRCERTGEPLAMILADIDDFKALNDRFGHAAGDEILVRIAGVMNETIRESDFLARYGGEEFVILTTGTDLDGTLTLAEKIRMRIADIALRPLDHPEVVNVTVSLGVALYRGDRRAFFREADRALYRAKDMGKNCTVVAGEDEPA